MSERITETTSRLTREQQAVAELGVTGYSRGVGEALVIMFLLTLAAVPVYETISDVRANTATRRQMLSEGVDIAKLPGRRPRSLDILNLVPSWQQVRSARSVQDWIELIPKPLSIRQYENSLVLNSRAGELIRPTVQWILTGWLGTGSEKVLIGRDGWLFYIDGVRYVTGPGFINPDQSSPGPIEEDPRRAIVQLHDELKRMGIALVIFPIPDKAMIRPASFSAPARRASLATQNPSWDVFSGDLQRQGIPLLDIAEEMYRQENDGRAQFLRTDSHWSQAGVDVAARALADFLTSRVGVPPAPAVQYSRRPIDFVRKGDLVDLLDLPASRRERLSPREQQTMSQVIGASGARWQPDPQSDVLLIGDSFLEMYSIEEGGVNPAAGLAEQLSYYLQRSVDRTASHSWGVYGARQALGESLAQVRQKARGRKIVVWEFAMRNLATAKWYLMD